MAQNLKLLVLLAGIAGAVFFFWPENDEEYLKKTTLKMIDLLVAPLESSNMASVVGRVRQVTEPMHFSVKFEISQNDRVIFKRESASSIRSMVGSYFGAKERLTLDSVKEENLTAQVLKESNDKKTGDVSFLITGQAGNSSMSCQVQMDWKYEKKEWRIYYIKASECQGVNVDFPY
ncbi:MAG: hypothetical protein OXK80_05965 [Bdellovibrionales bacterium]|nr:hypothetical protein [Bdellovibrionales bacterium]